MKAYENDILQVGQHILPLEDINYLDIPLLSLMDREQSFWKKQFRYKHFQFMGLLSEELIFGCAMLKAKIIRTAFCYIYFPKTDEMYIINSNDLLAQNSYIDTRPINNFSTFNTKALKMTFRQKGSELKASCVGHNLSAEITFSCDNFEPMCLLTETGGRGFTYAQKFAGIPCRGMITYKGQTYDLEALNAYAHHDWTGGFLSSETVWQWACFSGEVDGKNIGLNISCGVNETSYTENCFWVDGKLIKVDFVNFKFDRSDLTKQWYIKSTDGQIDLTFTPKGYNLQKKNFLVIKSNFKQIIGTFDGRVGDYKILNIHGFVEDQYLKW